MPPRLQLYPAPDGAQAAFIADMTKLPGVTATTAKDGGVTLSLPDPRPLGDQVAGVVASIQASMIARLGGGFVFAGHIFQSDSQSTAFMQGAAGAAQVAIAAGVGAVGNLRWADPAVDFVWIDHVNVAVAMDAPTMVQFFLRAVRLGQALVLYGRSLKDAALAAPDAVTLDALDITANWPT